MKCRGLRQALLLDLEKFPVISGDDWAFLLSAQLLGGEPAHSRVR
jgi:hypothetical protein